MKPDVKLPEGTTIGTWIIGSELGRGGQGVVWSAKPTTTRRTPPRALKACFSTDPTDRARFEREITLLKQCESAPNVLRIVDSDSSWKNHVDGVPAFAFHVSERCEGSLEERQRRLGDAGARLNIFRDACAAVRYLHELDLPLIHRDIKPANFLLALEPRRLVLADFGIARPIDTEEKLTQIQEVVGTQHFRAPEVSAGQPPSLRSDIFSLGRVLEWLLTGEVSTDLSTRPVPRGDKLSDEACVLLDAIIVKATEPVASKRFASVQELLAHLPDLWLSVRPSIAAPKVIPAARHTSADALRAAKDLARADDRAGWREVELELKRQYIEDLRDWRQTADGFAFADEARAYLSFGDSLYQRALPRLAFAMGGLLSQRAPFEDQRRCMEHLIAVPDWNWGGRIVALNAPIAVGFLYHHLHGALACELERFDLALALATSPYAHAEDQNKLTPLWKQHQLTGWPRTLGRRFTNAATYLHEAYERLDVLPALFANEADYHVALATYTMVLSLLEMASEATQIQALKPDQMRQGLALDVPPLFIGLPRDRLAAAARRSTGNREVVALVSKISGASRNTMQAAWPNWKRVLAGAVDSFFHDDLPLGDLG